MSDEDFLKRWSRRKREVQKTPDPAPVAEPEVPVGASPNLEGGKAAEPAFDLASLPPIESITAASDVSAFLRAGVPLELTRAALRRVWTSDPAIRDFVGLAENAWDFNDPNGIPGFGPLELTEETRALMMRAVQQTGEALQSLAAEMTRDEANANDSSALKRDGDAREPSDVAPPLAGTDPGNECPEQLVLREDEKDIAAQHDVREASANQQQPQRRGHGGALPRLKDIA